MRFYTVCVTFETLQRLFQRVLHGFNEPWEILAELLLIGLSVNWCANVLQGTRGTRLLRGLLILLVGVTLIVRVMAEQLGWTRLELLYRYFVVALAFIALIAFQPELRRALIRAGDVRFFRRSRGGSRVVPALVEAAGRLAHARHGALVAIQREVGLANWAENGIPINADLSADLLQSIFFPNSAMHDLGVIVRGNKVLAASCQFPLAESGDFNPVLGSRHRAAVGLSQESDALVMVVSEETGTISLSDQGELLRPLSLEALESELGRRLHGEAPQTSRFAAIRSFTEFKRLLRRALVVLPLTLVIWFLADQASMTRADSIPITLNIVPSSAVQVDVEKPDLLNFRLTVRGATRDVEALRASAAERPIRLDCALRAPYSSPGSYRLGEAEIIALLESQNEVRQRGIQIEAVTPGSMQINVDEIVTLTLPLRVEAGAVRIGDANVDPKEVTAWFRKADVEKIPPAVRTLTVRLAERLAGVNADEAVTIENAAVDLHVGPVSALRIEPAAVRAQVRVLTETITLKIPRVPVQVSASPTFLQQFELRPMDPIEWSVDVEIEGDRGQVEALKPTDISATVTLSSDLSIGDQLAATVQIRTPPGMKVLSPPRQVQFKLFPRENGSPE